MSLTKLLVIIIVLLATLSSAFGAVTYSIQAPTLAAAGTTPITTISVNTNGATVGGMGFTLIATSPLTFSTATRGTFVTAALFPTFNCNLLNLNAKLVCSISGTSGVTGGSGIIVNVPVIVPGGSSGSPTLTLSALSATDDIGNSIVVSGPSVPTSISIDASPCVEADWTSTLTPASCPASGSQTKSWTKTNAACTGGVSHPNSETVACTAPVACTLADYTITNPGACSVQCGAAGTQPITATLMAGKTCTDIHPTTQACTATCPQNFVCDNTHNCVAPSACNPGFHLDPGSGQCINDLSQCPNGATDVANGCHLCPSNLDMIVDTTHPDGICKTKKTQLKDIVDALPNDNSLDKNQSTFLQLISKFARLLRTFAH